MSEVATYEVSGYKEKTTTANNILKALFQMLLVSGVHPGQAIQLHTEPTDEVSKWRPLPFLAINHIWTHLFQISSSHVWCKAVPEEVDL